MPIDQQDFELLEQLSAGYMRVSQLELSESTEPWQRSALSLIESAHAEFKSLVEREDIEEAQALEAMQGVRAARQRLDMVFANLVAVLEIMHGEGRLEPAPSEGAEEGALAHFLARYTPGQFESLRDAQALKALEAGVSLLGGARRSELRQSLEEEAQQTRQGLKVARMSASAEGSEAVEAYAELVDGRGLAKVCYLTARDLISAALRFEGRHDELDLVLPFVDDTRTVGVKL